MAKERTYHGDLQEHAFSMVRRARMARRGIKTVAMLARGDLLGPDWQALLAEAFGADTNAGLETNAELAARAQRIRNSPAVIQTADVIMRRLYQGSTQQVDAVQRGLYVQDQQERARIYNRHTGRQWKIGAVIEDKELTALAAMSVLGSTRDELLAGVARQWRDRFVSAVVQSLAGKPGTFMTGIQVLARKVNGTFDWWTDQAGTIAESCAAEALAASAREAMRAFRPPRDQLEAAQRDAVARKLAGVA
jgi:hypothetical protein